MTRPPRTNAQVATGDYAIEQPSNLLVAGSNPAGRTSVTRPFVNCCGQIAVHLPQLVNVRGMASVRARQPCAQQVGFRERNGGMT